MKNLMIALLDSLLVVAFDLIEARGKLFFITLMVLNFVALHYLLAF